MSEGDTVKLRHPVTLGGKTIDELVFRRGRLGDLKGISLEVPTPISGLMLIASRLCGETTAVIERIDEEDASAVLGRAADFFQRCLATGDGASPS